MRKRTLWFLSIILVVVLIPMFYVPVNADAVTYKYTVNEDGTTCTITEMEIDDDCGEIELNLPSFCDDLLVTAVGPDVISEKEDSIKSIFIHHNITSFDASNFKNYNISYSVAPDSEYYSAEDGVLYNKDKTILYKCSVRYPNAIFEIPDTVEIINDYALAYVGRQVPNYKKSVIDEVSVPSSVKEIRSYAFKNALLDKLTFSEGVESIGDYALSEIIIPEIYLPDSVRSLGDCIFFKAQCKTLCRIGPNIENITDASFGGISSVASTLQLEYNENSPYVVYENAIYNKEKTKLCGYIVKNPTEIVIAETTEILSPYSFYNIHEFTKIDFPSSLKIIGDNAFYGCNSTADIILNEGLLEIGANAFYNNNAGILRIPESVEKIGKCAFYMSNALYALEFNCTKPFETVTLSEMLGTNETIEKITLPYSKTVNEIVSAYGGAIKTLVLTGDATLIDSSAFSGNSFLREIVLPKNVTEIGENAFYSCSALEVVSLPEGVTKINNSAFAYCRKLKSINLPESLNEIGTKTFYECESLETIVIPSSITKIEANVFTNSGISEMTFKGNITEIGEAAFSGCSNLKEITLPDGITSIAPHTFRCSGISEIVIPNSVTEIGEGAFCDSDLRKILLSDSLKEIPAECFYNCLLEYIKIPDSVVKIGNDAFGSCNYLVTAVLPKNLTTLGSDVFVNCTMLENINLPVVKTVPDRIFSGCVSLKNIEIPEGVEEISASAFYNCESLQELNIPASLISFNVGSTYNEYGFLSGLDNLKSINIAEDNMAYSSEDGVVFSEDKTRLIFYPRGKDEKYYVVPATTQIIEKNAFYDNPYLEEVVFQDGLDRIYDSMYNLSSLKKVHIPSSVTLITNVFLKKTTGAYAEKSDAVIYCEYGKCAYYTAIELGLNYVIILNDYLRAEKNVSEVKLDSENNRLLVAVEACQDLSDAISTEPGYFIETQNTHNGYCGTGTVVEVKNYDNETVAEYTLVVKGDINGDSVCDTLDAMLLQLEMYSQSGSFSEEAFVAADFSENNLINMADFQTIVNYIIEKDVSEG